MIKKVEEADSKSQHGESWKLINEISGRKTSKKGISKVKSQEERIKAWYIHFSNLLGKEPVTNNAGEEEITTVLHQLNIKTGLFTVKEYKAVKRKLKEDNNNNKKRSHTQLDSRKQVIAFQDRVMTINIKEAQHPLK